MKIDAAALRRSIESALAEDLGERGDITTAAVVGATVRLEAVLIARSRTVLAGLDVARAVFHTLDPALTFEASSRDGAQVAAGTVVATIRGHARPILEGERTALNFLQRMCGIATVTRQAVEEVAGTGTVVLDTRKTAPGLRMLDKYAVAAGGASNHRIGLFDAAMVKDTHLAACDGIASAVESLLAQAVPAADLTVEVRDVGQLKEAIDAGAGRALLDNMSLEEMEACVAIGRGSIVLEASGGLRPGKLREVAETGVDCISLGWLTHSVIAADVAMETRLLDP